MIKFEINGYEETLDVNRFPDGTLLFHVDVLSDFENYREATITWLFENNEELVTLIYLTKHMHSHGITSIYLNMPYIPNARQDRTTKEQDVFTLKHFVDVINWLEFDSVRVLDPHSSVSAALIDNIIVDQPDDYIEKALCKILGKKQKDITLFFTDEGGRKRYSEMFNLPYCFGVKMRDWQTGVIQGLDVIGDERLIRGQDILIVDDICSKGGTFYWSAKKLKELGANKIYLYVTHCENTILEGGLLESSLIEKVYTTNSIFTKEHKKIEVMEV